MKKKYNGVIIPAITPLNANFELDSIGVKNMFANFRANSVSPFILGTTGEAASLSINLKTDYIKLAGSLKQANDKLYVGIASNSFDESVLLSKIAFDNGATAVAAHLPSYYKLSDDQMKKYFEQMANKSAGPLIIYNIPATTHMSVPLSLIDELSYHDNIVGVKDSERSDERLDESLKLWSNRADFSYFLGWAARSASALLNGADGLIPSSGNLYPGIYCEMMQALIAGNSELVIDLQKRSDAVGKLYQADRLLGESLWALKVLMHEAGICQQYVMPPLQAQSESDEKQLIKSLHEYLQNDGLNLKVTI
jgi:dihydrodipicolinate synthase/N-acetylneuraminate lyase